MSTPEWMIYGANGYTGTMIARDAVARGHRPILAGRRRKPLETLASELGCELRVFSLAVDDLAEQLRGVQGVCLVAGPFTVTAAPMIAACLEAGVHYIDLATEVEVFELAKRHDATAKERGVALVPGAGFNVAVTDCMAVELDRHLSDPERLTLAVDFGGIGHSVGGIIMGVEALAKGTRAREDDRIVKIPMASRRMRIDFQDGPRDAAMLPFPFGDIVTARHSIGVANVELYLPLHPVTAWCARVVGSFQWVLATRFAQSCMRSMARWMLSRPDDAQRRAHARTYVRAELRSTGGDTVHFALTTRHSYEVSSEVAVRTVEALSAGAPAGFSTPGTVLGGREFLATLTETEILSCPDPSDGRRPA